MQNEILITGGCGFVGHHVVEHFIKNTDWKIFVLDKLSYASMGFDRLRDINVFSDKRVTILTTDLTRQIPEGIRREIKNVKYILHLAAESHVDNSIIDPEPFVMSNVVGTMNILNLCRKLDNLEAINYFSTDEVFGPAPEGIFFKEWDRYNSSNPYSASKAGGEELAIAWSNTFDLPIFITHTMNVFGERQHGEKYIPMVIKKVLSGEKIIVHSDSSKTKPGSRFYIHARNVAKAIHFILDKFPSLETFNLTRGKLDKFNIVGEKEVDNLELAKFIAKVIGKELNYELVDFHSSRPGHDLRYALDGTKMKEIGWDIPISFETSLSRTIKWYLSNMKWLF